jgi:hypothetical protein
MAERVQVQGLGDAVPGIQPTIQRAGQYSVGQRRAGRNKLMDLADALSQVNPILQQYTQVADIEAERFEDELSRKSPEEIQAMLQKTEGEFDKQVRKGAMSWLTSPVNQKRKLRAVGQASSRLLMEQVYNRLDNPEEGDEDLGTSDIISNVQQQFVANNTGLSQSSFAQEGLQQSINPQILPLVRQYDAQKSRAAKADTGFGTTSVFYELAKDGSNLGDYDEVTTASLSDAWENLNAFSASEQRDLLGKVFENLAKNGMEEKADSLLLWASKNINIGAAKMTEIEYDGYENMIERTSEAVSKLEDKERVDLVEQKVAEFQNAHTDIEINGEGTYNGNTYESIDSLILAAKQEEAFGADQVGLAQLRRNVDDFIKTDIDPKDFRMNKILRDPFGPGQAIDFNLEDLNTAYESIITSTKLSDDVLAGDEELINIQNFYMDSFQAEIQDELNSLLGSPIGSDKAEVTRQMKDFIRITKKEYKREQENALKSRIKFLTDKEQVKIKVSQSKEASKPSVFDLVFNDKEAKQLSLNNDLSVFGDPSIPTKERKKAFRNLWKTDGETITRLRLIASGEIPKIKAQQPKKYYSSRSGFGGSVGKEIKRVEYTKKEREEALNDLVQVQAAKGLLGDALLEEQPVTPYGIRFDPLLLNSSQFPLVSKAEILELIPLLDKSESERKSNKTFNDTIKKAAKIGEEDVLEFIRNQRNLFKNGLNEID